MTDYTIKYKFLECPCLRPVLPCMTCPGVCRGCYKSQFSALQCRATMEHVQKKPLFRRTPRAPGLAGMITTFPLFRIRNHSPPPSAILSLSFCKYHHIWVGWSGSLDVSIFYLLECFENQISLQFLPFY